MDMLFIIITFVYSLILSSFLNVVAFRLPKGLSIMSPPSHCPHCQQRLPVHDLIPIVSYIMLKGKCRFCATRITPLYIFGEIVVASVLTFIVWQVGFSNELWIAVPLVCLLSTTTVADVLYMIIPNKINLVGFLYFLVVRLFFYHPLFQMDYILGIFAGGGVLFVLGMLSRGGMGGGDIKLMAVVGLALGWKLTLLALFLASCLGSMWAIVQLIFGVFKWNKRIPFGPFLAIGSLLSYLYGMDLIQFYVELVRIHV